MYVQVTNPAIDPLREGLVMSLEVNIGRRGNILEAGPENASQVCRHVLSALQFTGVYYALLNFTNCVLVKSLFIWECLVSFDI